MVLYTFPSELQDKLSFIGFQSWVLVLHSSTRPLLNVSSLLTEATSDTSSSLRYLEDVATHYTNTLNGFLSLFQATKVASDGYTLDQRRILMYFVLLLEVHKLKNVS